MRASWEVLRWRLRCSGGQQGVVGWLVGGRANVDVAGSDNCRPPWADEQCSHKANFQLAADSWPRAPPPRLLRSLLLRFLAVLPFLLLPHEKKKNLYTLDIRLLGVCFLFTSLSLSVCFSTSIYDCMCVSTCRIIIALRRLLLKLQGLEIEYEQIDRYL